MRKNFTDEQLVAYIYADEKQDEREKAAIELAAKTDSALAERLANILKEKAKLDSFKLPSDKLEAPSQKSVDKILDYAKKKKGNSKK